MKLVWYTALLASCFVGLSELENILYKWGERKEEEQIVDDMLYHHDRASTAVTQTAMLALKDGNYAASERRGIKETWRRRSKNAGKIGGRSVGWEGRMHSPGLRGEGGTSTCSRRCDRQDSREREEEESNENVSIKIQLYATEEDFSFLFLFHWIHRHRLLYLLVGSLSLSNKKWRQGFVRVCSKIQVLTWGILGPLSAEKGKETFFT